VRALFWQGGNLNRGWTSCKRELASSQELSVNNKYRAMAKKMGRPKLPKREALGEVFAVRLRPDEARDVRQAIQGSGLARADWLRRALLNGARGLGGATR